MLALARWSGGDDADHEHVRSQVTGIGRSLEGLIHLGPSRSAEEHLVAALRCLAMSVGMHGTTHTH